jgi:hypothetical protein
LFVEDRRVEGQTKGKEESSSNNNNKSFLFAHRGVITTLKKPSMSQIDNARP